MRTNHPFTLPKHSGRWALAACSIALLGLACQMAVAEIPLPTLRAQVQALAKAHNFPVKALDKLGDDPGKPTSGSTREQLNSLLVDYNHVLLSDDSGAIISLIISSRIKPQPPRLRRRPREIEISTTRRGAHHAVETTITGPAGESRTLMLMVDTGASTIVLPRTMSKTLGFGETDLRDGWSQTANGRVRTRQGVLRLAKVGSAEVRDVKVNFLEDKPLGNNALLGMSFLSRFKVTIDDENDRLVLIKR